MTRSHGTRLGRGVEWEFDKVTFSREFPRTVVTKLLVERAEHGGWELDRVRIVGRLDGRWFVAMMIVDGDGNAHGMMGKRGFGRRGDALKAFSNA